MLKAGRSCPLTSAEAAGFNAVLVYSFLVYRLKMQKGDHNKAAVTNRQIHRGTGLCRSRTIPVAIQLLEKHGLLGRTSNRVFAHQGQSEPWFVQMKHAQNKPWYACFAYFEIWIPSSQKRRLTSRHNALFWLIVSKPRQRQSYYAMCLGIDEKTVSRAVKELRKLKLVSGSELEPCELTEEHLSMWQDKAARKATHTSFKLSKVGILTALSKDTPFKWFAPRNDTEPSAYESFVQMIDAYGAEMQNAGYSTVEISQYWDDATKTIVLETDALEPFELFVMQFRKIFQYIEALTLHNRAQRLFKGKNSLGLLKEVTTKAIHQLKAAWRNKLTYGGLCYWSWNPD